VKLNYNKFDETLKYWREHPVFAAEDILDHPLAPHQRIAFKGMWEAKWVLNIWGRGIGKSRIDAAYSLLRAVLYSREKIVIVAPSFRQSILVFSEIENIVDNHPILKNNFKRWPPTHNTLQYRAELLNGSTIIALPMGSDGAKIRGIRATVIIIDEAREVDKEVMENVIIPFMVSNKNFMGKYLGKQDNKEKNILILSTSAYYQFNHIYERYLLYISEILKGNKNYCVTSFDVYDAPDGAVDMEVVELQKKTMSELEFAMEYLAKMPKDSMGFYPASMLNRCRTRFVEPLQKGKQSKEYIIGVDPGDTSGLVVLEKDGLELSVVRAEELQVREGQLRQRIDDLLDAFPGTSRVAMETQGGGKAVQDLFLQERTYINKMTGELQKKPPLLAIGDKETEHIRGERKLEMINPQIQNIDEMNYDLRAKLEQQYIRFPASAGMRKREEDKKYEGSYMEDSDKMYANITELIRQITNVSTNETKRGYLSFDTPAGTRKDIYSALLYASWAADHQDLTPSKIVLPTGGWVQRR
jgi:hypothetical protein